MAVRMFVRHRVADYSAWRSVYDELDGQRAGLGVSGQAVYQGLEDPNDLTVTHDFATREAADSFASSPDLHGAMERAGVQGRPEIWFTTA